MSATSEKQPYDLNNPFLARITENRLLNKEGSGKEIRHFVVDISGSGLRYEAGDSLGIFPTNREEDVNAILSAIKASGDEPVMLPKHTTPVTFREALTKQLYYLAGPTKKLLQYLRDKTQDTDEQKKLDSLLDAANADQCSEYLAQRHFVDILEEFPGGAPTPQDFVGLAKRLTPRLYSIASSPLLHPNEIHLTVAAVRYETNGRKRVGVASTWASDRVTVGERSVPVFVASSHFKPPADTTRDVIMVGPGTGVAPFRAFLQDRVAKGATGKNWLFFGAQKSAYDYLYGEEFEDLKSSGKLHNLSLAWSRDQGHKVYVQDKMREAGAELWSWLQNGAFFYVCGDKEHMAKDVDAALHEIISQHGGLSTEQAVDYVKQLKKDKRYQRDVY